MDIPTWTAHTVENLDNGRFRVTLEPKEIDTQRPYAAQLSVDRFTPHDGEEGPVYYNGVFGDPEAGELATLEIDRAAMQENRTRRMSQAALTGGTLHKPEGTLYLSSDS